MKDLLNNWENSPKNKLFQRQLARKRRLFMNVLHQVIDTKMTTPLSLTRSELEETCDYILLFEHMPEATQQEYMLKDKHIFNTIPKPNLFHDFTSVMVEWYHNLKEYADLEDYEMCAKLRDVISIEMRNFCVNLKLFTADYDEQDIDLVWDINNQCKEHYKI